MMSNFNFSPRTIAALVMGLGVSFYATAGIGKLRIISADAQRFEAEIPIVDEPVPDSANVRLTDGSQFGLASSNQQASQLRFSRQGDRILVDGPMPPQGGDPLRFALEVSWPEGTLVREFQVQPLVAAEAPAEAVKKEESQPAPRKKKSATDEEHKAVQPDDAKLDGLKLGDLKVVSALGQPLSVEVDIYGNTLRKNSKSVKVQVFPDASIAGSDPDLMQTLSTLQYRIEKRPSGRHVLKLRSNKAVSEPILPLQIEAVSGNERSVRQYTVLLDPAGYQVAKSNAVHAGSTVSESPRKQRAVTRYTSRNTDKSLRPLKVYRVLKGDSLSEIAGKMRGKEGLAERMQQLKDANPDAFIRGDINLLRAGATLHYPAHWKLSASHDVVRQRPAVESQEEEASTSTAAPARSAKPSVRAATPNRSAVGAATEPRRAAPVAKIATPAVQSATTKQAMPPVAEPKAAAPAVKPVVPAPQSSPKPAAAKPAPASTSVAQPKPAPQQAQPVKPIAKSTEVPPAVGVKPVASPPVVASVGVAQVASTPAQAVASAPAGASAEKLARLEELRARAKAQDEQQKKTDEMTAALQAEIAKLNPGKANAQQPQPEEDESLFALVGDYYRPIGGAMVLALAAGGWWAWRRRRKNQHPYESLEGMTGEVSGLALTTLMSSNQPGAVEFDMADPLLEAENYMQDGSTVKALDVLREGLTREPMRQDVRLRLLEILARNNEQHAFVEEALVAKTLFGINSPLWQRTVELAQTLDPVPDLFANGGAGKGGDGSSRNNKGGVASPSAPAGV